MSEALSDEGIKARKGLIVFQDSVSRGRDDHVTQGDYDRLIATIESLRGDAKIVDQFYLKLKEENGQLKIGKRKNAELWQETEADLAKLKLEFKACEITNAFLQTLVNGLSGKIEKSKLQQEEVATINNRLTWKNRILEEENTELKVQVEENNNT